MPKQTSGPVVPPQDRLAEVGILGNALFDNAVLDKTDVLRPGMFYHGPYQVIFDVMLDMRNHGKVIDHITLTDELRNRGVLEKVGGGAAVAALIETAPSSPNIGVYCAIVKNKWELREIRRLGAELERRAREDSGNPEQLRAYAEQQLLHIANGTAGGGFVSGAVIATAMLTELEQVARGEIHPGISSGFIDLDRLIPGWQAGELIIIAARPSHGKTSLALAVAADAAVHGKSVGIFSLEMPRGQLMQRLVSARTGIDLLKFRKSWMLTLTEWTAIREAKQEIDPWPLEIDDTGVITVQQIGARARRLKAAGQLDLLIIDYLQLIQGVGRETRQAEVAEISRSLKLVAKELGVPVLCLSQLSRECEKEKRRPQLSDLRDSGGIEQDADVVIFIHRDVVYDPNACEKGIAEILVRKSRNGPVGDLRLGFQEHCARFVNLTTAVYEEPHCAN